jgi:hypothetical protein
METLPGGEGLCRPIRFHVVLPTCLAGQTVCFALQNATFFFSHGLDTLSLVTIKSKASPSWSRKEWARYSRYVISVERCHHSTEDNHSTIWLLCVCVCVCVICVCVCVSITYVSHIWLGKILFNVNAYSRYSCFDVVSSLWSGDNVVFALSIIPVSPDITKLNTSTVTQDARW